MNLSVMPLSFRPVYVGEDGKEEAEDFIAPLKRGEVSADVMWGCGVVSVSVSESLCLSLCVCMCVGECQVWCAAHQTRVRCARQQPPYH